MPILETPRLLIRPFVMEDMADAHRLFDLEINAEDLHTERITTIEERAEWLQWTVLNYRQLAKLYQPPYGDRAIVLKAGDAHREEPTCDAALAANCRSIGE